MPMYHYFFRHCEKNNTADISTLYIHTEDIHTDEITHTSTFNGTNTNDLHIILDSFS